MNAATGTLSQNNSTPYQSHFLIRLFASFLAATVLLYLASRFLIYWYDWPDLSTTIASFFNPDSTLESTQKTKGILLLAMYAAIFLILAVLIKRKPNTLSGDAEVYKNISFFIVRAAFWAVFLVGLADAVVSFLRVEELLDGVFGEKLAQSLNQPIQRGLILHYPLLILSLVIAWFSKSLGFIWLALLVVLAEFTIVITRFVFSYEQSFMGDLVRFWYAAFFLFAAAYTLVENGHVRVDVLYAKLSNRKKAWVNAIGSIILGLPVCWTILHYGMGTKQSSLIAPILSFEVTSSGYGMYIKYLMAAFLIIYAVSMALVFISIFLKSSAYLLHEEGAEMPSGGEH